MHTRLGPQRRAAQSTLATTASRLMPLIAVGVQERVVIPERDAAVGIAVGAEHVGVRQQAAAAEDRLLAADRFQPQRRHAVKQRLARLEFVDMRRRGAAHPDLDEARIVELGAEARMRFQLAAVGQVDRVRGDS